MAILLFLGSARAQKHEVHILSVNDMHATINLFPKLAALADSLREIDPSLLVFSAGDNRTGNPLNDKYVIPAYPMVALMNQVGFDGSAIGNHEFDQQTLPRLIGLSNFRYICANIFPDDSVNLKTVPYQIFDAGGVKVGVLGAVQLNSHGIPSTHPDNVRGISFKPAREVIGQYEWLSKECDVTILLSHLGYDEDIEMTKLFPWLDLIIGGHTHTQLTGKEKPNGILITQNKNKLHRATHITLTLDSGRVVDKQAEYIDVKSRKRVNGLVSSMVRHFSNNATFQRVVAQAATTFRNKEELGCMMCDAYKETFNADIGIVNPGGVRIDSLCKGDISVLDVLEMDPFDNHAVVLNLTGEELLRMLLTYSNGRVWSFPFVSGMRCEVEAEPDQPNKIKSVRLLTVDGNKFDMKRKYRVVTNSYIPSTSKIPEGSAQIQKSHTIDVLMIFLEEKKVVDYQGVSRRKIITNAPTPNT